MGKSTKGQVVRNEEINQLIIKISENIGFIGPINFQLFKINNEELCMIEINPRIAGDGSRYRSNRKLDSNNYW